MVIVISFFEAIFSLLCVMMGISNPSWFTGIVLSSRPHTALCVCVCATLAVYMYTVLFIDHF